MNRPDRTSAPTAPTRPWFATAAISAVLIAFIVLFVQLDPLARLNAGPPPPEQVDFERVTIDASGFSIDIRSAGAAPTTIVQVMVDGAYWQFTAAPTAALRRFDTATLHVPYPWVEGETHHLRLLTGVGATFDHTVDVAGLTPIPDLQQILHYVVLGIFVGVVPIVFGMAAFPLLKSSGERGVRFVLALTSGLLVYLALDMAHAGLVYADAASELFGGAALVWVPLLLTLGLLQLASRHDGIAPAPARLALMVALGIGLHNLGEGLAIGAAIASHEMALGAFLVIGFTLHNTTEGVAVVSPLARAPVSLTRLATLALLAGLPVAAGIGIGAFFFYAHWAAVFFGIGAGAVLRVVIDIDRHAAGHGTDPALSRFAPVSVAGYACGLALMYLTALLIDV